MHHNGIREKLFSILEKKYGFKLIEINPDLPIFDHLAIDSMQLVAIAADVENEFAIELPLTFLEKPTLNNFLEMVIAAVEAKAA